MKYFNVDNFSICMKQKAKDAITDRHMMRLKKSNSLADRTNSSKIRWREFDEMAIEFNCLKQKYNLI